ncbi:transferrin-binding protein-like solute binding protein [Eleftheria terrae]|uniref:transferrin-binding protein-like solute binding protein n=1 Tax=Eleftheria terrae TaxID=1597781 RepID=UPI00263B983E|nr:transferrin-binding protein-like solute binding protein [Eleftheria terrae]WKB56080.1 transferrin-binding protein-like solute binding protein [Eleftheria terrae]
MQSFVVMQNRYPGRSITGNQVELDFALHGMSSGYELEFVSGSLRGGYYLSPLVVLPARLKASASYDVELNGFKVKGSESKGAPPADTARRYLASVQTLVDSGIVHVGMGNWKYYGDYQSGYFSGERQVVGSFVFGTPTPVAQVDAVKSGSYAGHSHGTAQLYSFDMSWFDRYDQSTAKANITYDATTRSVTVTLLDFQVWLTSLYSTPWATWDPSDASSTLITSLSCTGTVPVNANIFTCAFADDQGFVQGKFFGPNGSEIGGTFNFRGVFHGGPDEAVAGAFVAKRN